MSSYKVSQNSVITSVFGNRSFLTCGGTNINTPKNSTPWADFDVTPKKFAFIFNSTKFSTTTTKPIVKGYNSTATTITTIKNLLHDGANIEYICGTFSLTTPTRNNIMYINPNISDVTGNADFLSLSNIVFTGTNNTVNCMAFGTTDKSRIYIAGNFTNASIGTTSSPTVKNIALLNKAGSVFTIVNTIPANAVINASNTIINSMIVIGSKLYVAGTDGTNCLFYSYNIGGTTAGSWTNLLIGGPYIGTINILQFIIGKNNIAIGGQFVNLGTATGCNNIVLYIPSSSTWTALGSGVTGTGASASAPWGVAQVFALSYIQSKNILWVGGYFLNGNGSEKNSIATVNLATYTWDVVKKLGSAVIGLKYFDGTDQPGVVYCFTQGPIDTANVVVGGSFITTSTKTSTNMYNLAKITLATPESNRTTEYNINSI